MNSPLKNQRGVLTIDFLFAFVLVFGLTMTLFFSLTFTLSVVEVVQYITFASARNYFAAHHTEAKQKELAKAKFDKLKNNGVFSPLFSNGWYELGEPDIRSFETEYSKTSHEYNTFAGTRVSLQAKVLDFRIPFIGSTTDGAINAFKTNISSFLAREPTADECMTFNQGRLQAIKALGYGGSAMQPSDYFIISDNGC